MRFHNHYYAYISYILLRAARPIYHLFMTGLTQKENKIWKAV